MHETPRNLIIGTGPASLAAAMALRRLNVPFEVIDVAYDLEPETEARLQSLAASGPAGWQRDEIETLFPPPVTSPDGVEKRLSFGSEFPYRRPDQAELTFDRCKVDLSHGFGGFGNVWGAATLPYADADLAAWPLSAADLAPSYRNISRFVPVSAELDDLQGAFPIHRPDPTGLERSEQTENILAAFRARKRKLDRDGVSFGRARVAVDSSGGAASCRYCGLCLDGCAYGSIFNPRLVWKRLQAEGVRIHKGLYALEFSDHEDRVDLTTVAVDDYTVRQWRADRLFVGAGAIGTTRMVARSLKLIDRPIRLLDSQYFFFPLLAWRAARDATVRFTLAEMFVEVLNREISDHYVHFQVYGLSEIFKQTIHAMAPPPLRRPALLDPIHRRFYLFQGFLHSADSGYMELTIRSSRSKRDVFHIRGVDNPLSVRIARDAQRLLRRRLAGFGMIPPMYLKIVPLGRSFHAGGSFPAGSDHPVFSSDSMGRPAGLQRVHILDAATFASIPATTITWTAMANSDRVINETHANLNLL